MDKTMAKNYLKTLEEYARKLIVEKDTDLQTLIAGLIVIVRFILDDKVKEDGSGSTAYI